MAKFDLEVAERLMREALGGENDTAAQAKKRARIRKAAVELFLQHGYRKTSIDDVARRADIAKGTLYLYFKSKGDLLVHVLAWEKKGLWDKFMPLLTDEIPEPDRLRTWLKMSFTLVQELPLGARLLSGDNELLAALDDIGAETMAASMVAGEQWVMDLIEMAAPGAFGRDTKLARARVLLGLRFFSGLALDEKVRSGMSLEAFSSTLADMIVDGTRPATGAASRRTGGAPAAKKTAASRKKTAPTKKAAPAKKAKP